MLEMFQLPFMQQALVVCLLLSLALPYFGVHVVKRGIVFIDLALAQIASVGAAVAIMAGWEPHVPSILFTLVGAVLLSFVRNRPRVSQEAIIGIIYATAAAFAMLVIAKTAHGEAAMSEEMFGNVLAATPEHTTMMTIIFAVIAIPHLIYRKQFFALTEKQGSASLISPWNLLFYLTLALVISEAVGAAGVLQVFTYLVAPASCALLLCENYAKILGLAWLLAIIASLSGLYASYTLDLPTGAAIVACFGMLFIVIQGIVFLKEKNYPSSRGSNDPIPD